MSLFDQLNPTPIAKPKRVSKSKILKTENGENSTAETSLGFCPNLFPTQSASYRICIVGEAPGDEEVRIGQPFIGQSGRFLDQVLAKAGINRSACLIANICQHRPPANDISKFSRSGKFITEGLSQLATDLRQYDPHLCLLLGKTSLWAANGSLQLDNWKGYFFLGDREPFLDRKCIATWHPAAALRQYADYSPWITFAATKARAEGERKELILPERTLVTKWESAQALCAEMDRIIENKIRVALDIEGDVRDMSCCSFATSPSYAFIVPFSRLDGSSYWENEEDEIMVWERFIRLLSEEQIKKILQNFLYDAFVNLYSHSIIIRGLEDDTMLKAWENLCELEKALAVLVSIYNGTQPYYKQDRKTDDQDTFFRYCCLDSCNTFEISEKLNKYLDAGQKSHYRENMELLAPLLYMQLRGIRYNADLAASRLEEMKGIIYETQTKLDEIARDLGAIEGLDLDAPKESILDRINSICCFKRDQTKPKKEFEESYSEILKLIAKGNLSSGERGRIATELGLTMNIKSTKFKDFLYGTCKLPTQYKKDLKTKELRPTTEYKALLKLSKSHPHPALNVALELSRLRTRAQMLAYPSLNGRIHCNYNLVGSETGRITCSKSNMLTKSGKKVGANLQTIPSDWDTEDEADPLSQGMRDLFLADEGCYIGKCDLKGSDGYTIGAFLAAIGEPTMLDDLNYGLKPAQIVAYSLINGSSSTIGKTRAELKIMLKEVSKECWQYFSSKCLIWGRCYLLGPIKGSELVFVESEGKVNLSQKEINEIFNVIEQRYRVSRLHRWMEQHMKEQNYPAKLIAPNGFVRKFFSRNFGAKVECTGEALSHLPQVMTTATVNRAMHKLWTDPENYRGNKLIVEPLHSVHDELVTQWKIEDTEFAITKLRLWFDNLWIIRGQKITIPFTGEYGLDWSMGKDSIKGTI